MVDRTWLASASEARRGFTPRDVRPSSLDLVPVDRRVERVEIPRHRVASVAEARLPGDDPPSSAYADLLVGAAAALREDVVGDAVAEALDAGAPFDVEVRFRTPDGEVRWLRIQGVPEMERGEVVSLRGAAQESPSENGASTGSKS